MEFLIKSDPDSRLKPWSGPNDCENCYGQKEQTYHRKETSDIQRWAATSGAAPERNHRVHSRTWLDKFSELFSNINYIRTQIDKL